jgi:hypothetical protein
MKTVGLELFKDAHSLPYRKAIARHLPRFNLVPRQGPPWIASPEHGEQSIK